MAHHALTGPEQTRAPRRIAGLLEVVEPEQECREVPRPSGGERRLRHAAAAHFPLLLRYGVPPRRGQMIERAAAGDEGQVRAHRSTPAMHGVAVEAPLVEKDPRTGFDGPGRIRL